MKSLSNKQLRDYVPGQGCLCGAWHVGECCCNVDWTPKEVYVLRNKVAKLQEKVKRLEGALEERAKAQEWAGERMLLTIMRGI